MLENQKIYFSENLFFSFQGMYSNCCIICVIWYWNIYQSSQVIDCGKASYKGKVTAYHLIQLPSLVLVFSCISVGVSQSNLVVSTKLKMYIGLSRVSKLRFASIGPLQFTLTKRQHSKHCQFTLSTQLIKPNYHEC